MFCAACNESINDSTTDKRGIRCQGCRRWFHNRCRKALPPLPPLAREEQQRQGRQGGAYFHCGECRRQYNVLADTAAKGDAMLQSGRSVRLLELAAIKNELEGRTLNGTLPTKAQVQRAWGAAADSSHDSSVSGSGLTASAGADGTAAATASAGSHSGTHDGASQPAVPGNALQVLQKGRRHRAPSGLETFLAVSELLDSGPFEEPAEDLLEDAFGVVLRHK